MMVDQHQRSVLLVCWKNMIQRCCNPNRPEYKNYGGRGITVCDAWRNSFPSFLAWAIESGHRSGLTLDRIDTNGPYSSENCRWATRKEQAINRRNTRFLTLDGEAKPMKQWSEDLCIENSTLWRRLDRGWPIEKALMEPVRKRRKHS